MDLPITSYSERLERASPQIVTVSTKIKTSDPGYSSSGVLAGSLRLINLLSPASIPVTSSFKGLRPKAISSQYKIQFLAIFQLREGLWHPTSYPIQKIAAKIILPKRSKKLYSQLIENHLEIDRITNSASGILSSFHHFNFTQIPLFPRIRSGP